MSESPFCDSCQRNQLLVNKTLAEYIPDEDDPEYEKYAASADEYRAELEERYPQVCENCIDRVQQQIRAAGYATKADNLRRVLEQSRKYRTDETTARQFWTLAIIWLAKCIYIFSVAVGLLWHGFGMIVAPPRDWLLTDDYFSWKGCFTEAVTLRYVTENCLLSTYILRLVEYALIADCLTLWWNPKLKQKTNRAGGRLRGLLPVWLLRIFALVLRYLSLRTLRTVESDEKLQFFHYAHRVLFVILLLSTVANWTFVRITYQSAKSLMQPLDAHLPSAPNSAERPKRTGNKSPLPNNTSFDTMAQSFTSSFPIGGEQGVAYPPSPTLTAVSSATQDTDIDTPYLRNARSKSPGDTMEMDWTPTQKRFAPQQPSILSSQWAQSSPPNYQPVREPHSLFSKPDPNPFRHKIPAAPKAPAASKVDPWKPGVWAPPLKETTKNFFRDEKLGRGEGNGLEGFGVPRNVQREAELFEAPKLKYDYYGKVKETGLEGSFNDLFSK